MVEDRNHVNEMWDLRGVTPLSLMRVPTFRRTNSLDFFNNTL